MTRTPADGSRDAVIVGAGLAGLACARALAAAGRDVLVLEASDGVGGRVRTDVIDGFRVDRGFQVLLTAYPECRARLDLDDLALGRFLAAADVRVAGRVHRVADPFRHPVAGVRSLLAPVLSVRDALRVALLRRHYQGMVHPSTGPDVPTTREELVRLGFSEHAIERFFAPFFGGVFLERGLETPATFFAFVYAMFAAGHAALPNAGMQAIPEQLAAGLPGGAVRLHARVTAVTPGQVRLAGGETIAARDVVIATDADGAAEVHHDLRPLKWRGTTMVAFAAERPPYDDPILHLAADEDGPVHHVAVPSSVAPGYAPPGGALVYATTVDTPPEAPAADDAAHEQAVRAQLRTWFGPDVDGWRTLAIRRIPRSLPRIVDPNPGDDDARCRIEPGVWRCGDALENPSLNGAMVSGRRAAEAILRSEPDR